MRKLFSSVLLAVVVFALAVPVSAGMIYAGDGPKGELIGLTNQSRIKMQVQGLGIESELMEAAQAKAEDMARLGYFAHIGPESRTPWDFVMDTDYGARKLGENLALVYGDNISAQAVLNAWLESRSHKQNIQDNNFQDTGMGIAKGEYKGYEAYFIVQVFGKSY
jgi:uncharacterized protein YkwD